MSRRPRQSTKIGVILPGKLYEKFMKDMITSMKQAYGAFIGIEGTTVVIEKYVCTVTCKDPLFLR